jgi:hypothetical protein
MTLACPGLDHARDMLVIAQETLEITRQALDAVGRIEALAAAGGDSAPHEIIIAAGAARALRPSLEARCHSMQLILAVGRATGDAGLEPAARPAERGVRPVLQLALPAG